MNSRLPVPLALGLSLTASFAGDLPQRQIDLEQLIDPETRIFEYQKMANEDEITLKAPTSAQRNAFLERARLIECPQVEGEPLYCLMTARFDEEGWPLHNTDDGEVPDWLRLHNIEQSLQPSGNYPEDEPLAEEEKEAEVALKKFVPFFETTPVRLQQWVIEFFDSAGKEQWIFGGDNMLSDGYLFDINQDGILERIDTTNYGVNRNESTKVVTISTVEHDPRVLLSVLYEWHPDKYEEEIEWGYSCLDLDGDQVFEFVLGPRQPSSEHSVVPKATYRWNASTKTFDGPDRLGPDSHILRLSDEGPWKSFREFNKVNPLSYHLTESKKKKAAQTKKKNHQPTPAQPPAFEMVVLESLSNKELWDEMGSGRQEWDQEREETTPTELPKDFWNLSPKEAALSFVKSSQDPKHASRFHLGYRAEAPAPPNSGWVVSRYQSSSCYVYTEHIIAVSFGHDSPHLLYLTNSQNGVVGSRPMVDQIGYDLRKISLTPKEATQIAETIWWLDQIRSQGKEDEHSGGMSSSADGSGSIAFLGKKDLLLAEDTIWATHHLSNRWEGPYTRETMLNFTDRFFDFLPEELGERWDNRELSHRNLISNTEERLQPRLPQSERERIAELTNDLLQEQLQAPLPPDFLAALCAMIAESGLQEIELALKELQRNFAAPSNAEKRLQELEEKFGPQEEALRNDFENRNSLYDEPDYQELVRLRQKSFAFPHATAMPPLEEALSRLALLQDNRQLGIQALENSRKGFWALQQLSQHHPETYLNLIEERFHTSENILEKQECLTIFASRAPDRLLDLTREFSEVDWENFAIPVAEVVHEHAPELLPSLQAGLYKIVARENEGWSPRSRALRLLVPEEEPWRFPDPAIEELLEKLSADPNNKADETMPQVMPAAITEAIILRDCNPKSWQILTTQLEDTPRTSTDQYLDLLVVYGSKNEKRKQEVSEYLAKRIPKNHARIDQVHEVALALDLRELRSLIKPLATPGPSMLNGEGVNRSTGHMEVRPQARFHSARHLCHLWNEDSDPLQTFRAWTAFALQQEYLFRDRPTHQPSLLLRKQLFEHSKACPQEEGLQFLQWCREHLAQKEKNSELLDELQQLVSRSNSD